jgi:hypothetical protein
MLRKLTTTLIAVPTACLAIASSTYAVRPPIDGAGSGSTVQGALVNVSAFTELAGKRSHPSAGTGSAPMLDALWPSSVHRPGFQP